MQFDAKFCEEYFDQYNIYNLITKIDKNYKLYFNKKEKMFLIVNTAKNYQISYKSDKILPNITNLLLKSRIENLNKIIKDIDEINEKILKKNQKKLKNETIDKMLEMSKLCNRTNSINQNQIKKIIGDKIC